MSDDFVYHEKCNSLSMPTYSFFIDKLKSVQKLSHKIYPKVSQVETNECAKCRVKKYYQLSNIVWPDTVIHKILNHKLFPSEYFINMILTIDIFDNYIINPPLQVQLSTISEFKYIPLHYNKLLIIDALMHQGSQRRYSIENSEPENFIYSEHSGVISIKNNSVDNIIVSAETNRTDRNDKNIYLPINTDILAKYEYIFHTHPNTGVYGGRITEGIIYEFPSANDLMNYVKYHNMGKVLASVVVVPEGIYVVRQIVYRPMIEFDMIFYERVKEFILWLEKRAIKKFKSYLDKLKDPDTFHQVVGSDVDSIKLYNQFIRPTNLFIEYYPRIKKNNEWCLRQIYLPYVKVAE